MILGEKEFSIDIKNKYRLKTHFVWHKYEIEDAYFLIRHKTL